MKLYLEVNLFTHIRRKTITLSSTGSTGSTSLINPLITPFICTTFFNFSSTK